MQYGDKKGIKVIMTFAKRLQKTAATRRRSEVLESIECASRNGRDYIVIEKDKVDKDVFDELVEGGLKIESYKGASRARWKISWSKK